MAKDRMDRQERKELRQPDEFVTATSSAFEWASKNSTTVMLIAGGAVAIFLGVGFYGSFQAAQQRDSNADLAGGMAAFGAKEYDAAATQLDAATQQWPGTRVAALAAVLEANSKLRAGDPDGAIGILAGLDLAALPAYLRQQSQLAWASALEAQDNWADAAAKYAEAAANDGPYTADAMVGEARCRAGSGEADRARELYRKVVEDYPNRFDKELLEAKAA